MNSLVRRYAVGKPLNERLKLHSLWKKIQEEESRALRGSSSFHSRLSEYGPVAIRFISEMKRRGYQPAEDYIVNSRIRYGGR